MVILDLETVAMDGVEIEPVSAPSNYKDPDKIAAYISEKSAEQVIRAALYPWTARIVALGWCEEGEHIERVSIAGSEAAEATLLREFWQRVVDTVSGTVAPIITFGGRRFDLPVLMARSRLLGVPAPVLSLDRYRSPHPDMLEILTFQGAIDFRSLRWFAKRFGLNAEDAFSGKEIAQLVEDQNWDAVRTHCASDVRLTRQLAERLGIAKAAKVAA